MAKFLMILAVFCTGRVHSLMEFSTTGAGVGSPDLGLSLHGPTMDMDSLAYHAEGALAALSDSMGISFSKSKKKTDIHPGSGTSSSQSSQARPASWVAQRVPKPTTPKQPPCSHISSDQKLPLHQVQDLSSKVDVNQPSSNIAMSLAPIPSKVDISTNQQYTSLPKVDISTNHQDISLPVKDLNSNRSSNMQFNSYLIPAFSHHLYAVNENSEKPIAGTLVPPGANGAHHSISTFYKQPQVFSHTSDSTSPTTLSRPPYPAAEVSITNLPSSYGFGEAASHTPSTKGTLPPTFGYVVPPVSVPHMIYTVKNYSGIPLINTQVKVNSEYPNQQFPPYTTYFPFAPFCHHSKSNLPPLSGSVLPHPFTVNPQPPQHLPPAVPYYSATPNARSDIYASQPKQDYYEDSHSLYFQNDPMNHGSSDPVNAHMSYNQ